MAAVAAGPRREALEAPPPTRSRAAGVETPRLDAELLLAEATGCDRRGSRPSPSAGGLAAPRRARSARWCGAALRREPVAYILGRKGFRRIELAVDRRVLIPRPETELLVEIALELEPRSGARRRHRLGRRRAGGRRRAARAPR